MWHEHRLQKFPRSGKEIRLKDLPTKVDPFYSSKADYRKLLAAQVEELSSLQQLLYADDRYSLLLVFQAM